MARFRYGNNYRVAIGKEFTSGAPYDINCYGTGETYGKKNGTWAYSTRWEDLITVPDKVEFFPEPTIIQTGNKTQSGLGNLCETDIGYENIRVVLSGNLSDEQVEMLFNAYGLTLNNNGPFNSYTLDGIPANLPSYVILRIWDDAPVTDGEETAPSKYKVDIATGCQLSELKITGNSGDLVKYEATFMAYDFRREELFKISNAVSSVSDDPGTPCTEGFNFGNIDHVDVKFGHNKHIKSFSLTLGSELADDATSYQNSRKRLAVIPTAMTGEFQFTNNYDPDNAIYDQKMYSDFLNKRKATHFENAVIMQNTKKIVEISVNLQITGYTFADPDKQLFENNITGRLVNTPGNGPFVAEVAHIPQD